MCSYLHTLLLFLLPLTNDIIRWKLTYNVIPLIFDRKKNMEYWNRFQLSSRYWIRAYSCIWLNISEVCLLVSLCNSSSSHNDFNPYNVLGLTRTASDKEIRQAYKRLARHWHPDKNSEPNAHEQFTKINAAYEVTSPIAQQSFHSIFLSSLDLIRFD